MNHGRKKRIPISKCNAEDLHILPLHPVLIKFPPFYTSFSTVKTISRAFSQLILCCRSTRPIFLDFLYLFALPPYFTSTQPLFVPKGRDRYQRMVFELFPTKFYTVDAISWLKNAGSGELQNNFKRILVTTESSRLYLTSRQHCFPNSLVLHLFTGSKSWEYSCLDDKRTEDDAILPYCSKRDSGRRYRDSRYSNKLQLLF